MYKNQLLTEKLFVNGLDKDLWYLLCVIYGLNCFLFTFEWDNLLPTPIDLVAIRCFLFTLWNVNLKQFKNAQEILKVEFFLIKCMLIFSKRKFILKNPSEMNTFKYPGF